MMGALLAVLLAATTPPLPQTTVQDLPTDATATNSGAALSVACTDANINACGANSTLELATAGFLGASASVTTSSTLAGTVVADCALGDNTRWTPSFFYSIVNGRRRQLTMASGVGVEYSVFACGGSGKVRLRLQVVTSGSIPTNAATLRATMHDGRYLQPDEQAVPTYTWAVTKAAAGASKLYADLFNASGSGKILKVRAIFPIAWEDVAVVGAVSVRLDVFRTSAVGTGGTAAVYKSATVEVAGGTITPMDTNNEALPTQVTARAAPTAGATIAEWIDSFQCYPEEGSTAPSYICSGQTNMSDAAGLADAVQRRTFREGQGILIKQNTVASVGSLGFKVVFTLE